MGWNLMVTAFKDLGLRPEIGDLIEIENLLSTNPHLNSLIGNCLNHSH